MGAALAFACSHTKTANSHIQATLIPIWHTPTCNHRYTPVKVAIRVCLFVLTGSRLSHLVPIVYSARNCM